MAEISTAADAYAAIADAGDALRGLNMPEVGTGEYARLQDRERAARAWLAAHPDEAREARIRGHVGAIHHALHEYASEGEAARRITLAMMLAEAADLLRGEARKLEQVERDRAMDADRKRRERDAEVAARQRRPSAETLRRVVA